MVYVGFVLQAMGTDFYPRLTVVAHDNRRCNQLVNEQAEISILLALPGVLATLALAPWVIQLFYSNRFDKAAEILCWQVRGTFLQVNSWPMGFIILAKGRAAALFWTDFAAYSVYVALAGWPEVFRPAGHRDGFFGIIRLSLGHDVLSRSEDVGIRVVKDACSPFSLGETYCAITLCTRLTLPEPWATTIGCPLALATGLYTDCAL